MNDKERYEYAEELAAFAREGKMPDDATLQDLIVRRGDVTDPADQEAILNLVQEIMTHEAPEASEQESADETVEAPSTEATAEV